MNTTNPNVKNSTTSRPDYSKWALGCLFRELRKQFPRLYGDMDTVSGWCVDVMSMEDRVPHGTSDPVHYWLNKYFFPAWSHPETPIILEIKRRLAEYNHAKEAH